MAKECISPILYTRLGMSNSIRREFKPGLSNANANSDGSLRFDPKSFVTSDEHRLHQVHLDGGDASSDSYCFPS